MSQTFKLNKWSIFFQMVSNMIRTLVPQVKEHFQADESMMFEEILENFSYEDLATWLILDTEENKPVSNLALDQMMLNMNMDRELSQAMKEGILSSYNGFYRVNNITSDFIFLENLLIKEPPKHIPTDSAPQLKEGMILLARLVETGHYPLIFRILHKVEPEQEEDFAEQFLSIYHMMEEFKRSTPELMKHRGLDIFLLYSNTFKEMNMSEEQLIDEYNHRIHDLFEEEIITVTPMEEENDRLETFIYIQEEYLEDKDLTFQQFESIDLKKLMESVTRDGVFESDQELSDFVSFLEEWSLSQGFETKLGEIKEIQDHIFKYKQLLQQSIHGIYLDDYILSCIHEEEISKDSKQFIHDFNQFIELFYTYPYFNLTGADRLSRSAIDIFMEELSLPVPEDIKEYSEIHFPMLHLWHRMGRMKNLLHRDGKKLLGSTHFDHFQKLSLEGQLSLWIQSIFNSKFLDEVYGQSPKSFSSGDGQDMLETYGMVFQTLYKYGEIGQEDMLNQGMKAKDLFVLDLFVSLGLVEKGDLQVYRLTFLGEKIGSYYDFLAGTEDGIIYIDRL